MTSHDTDHDDHDDHHEESFTLTIKTLAGHKLNVEVIGTELVAAVALEATIEFRGKHELAADGADYALTLLRSGPGGTLEPSSSLSDVGVRAHDELLLVSRAPHVDG